MRSRSRSLLSSVLLVAALGAGACKKAESPAAPAPSTTSAAPASAPSAGTEAKPHGDHVPKFGGVVMMTADAHVEAVIGQDGKHRIYFSDNARDPLPASTHEKMKLVIVRPGQAAEEIVLARDAKNEGWEGQGQPVAEPAKADITLHYNKPGQPPAPPQKIVFAEAHAHAAGSHHTEAAHDHDAPHGGVIANTAAGHLELVAKPDGAFELWLLDEKLAPRPVTGASASLKVAVPGYADVTLAAKGDRLEGKGAALTVARAPAVATVKLGDQVETARFELKLTDGDRGAPPPVAGQDHGGHDHGGH